MNPLTHALSGWLLAETVPELGRREKRIVVVAALAPDVDGVGLVAELLTRDSANPLLWWSEYHHLVAHNLAFAVLTALCAAAVARVSRTTTAALAFVAVHLHLLGDVAGSRGPDDYQWPIGYLYPFTTSVQWTWSGQWYLDAWPNIVLTAIFIAATSALAWRRGYSIVSLFSRAADEKFVGVLRARFGDTAADSTSSVPAPPNDTTR
ncbi:MAG TPA: metal-dependent hydrolase [Thermoanaerobaculia bacterium]